MHLLRGAQPLLVFFLAGISLYVQSAEPPAPGHSPIGALEFRRVFVPQEELSIHARGLLPLNREEFQRRIAILNAKQTAGHRSNEPRIERSEYTARLDGESLVAGEATLDVHCEKGEPQFLSMADFNLAIGIAAWDAAQRRPASLGLSSGGQVAVVVEQSGKLVFPWSLRGRRDALGDLTFDVRLPRSPVTQLRLLLPARAELKVTPGVAIASASTAEETEWLVELGGNTRATLQVVADSARRELSPLVLVRETATYTFSPGTVDLEAALEIDVHHQPLRKLALIVESPLTITSMRWGEQPLVWSVTSGDTPETKHVVAEVPEPFIGSGGAIQLTAVAEWPVDERFRLPRITFENGMWQEGSITLAAARSLRLQATAIRGCEQTSAPAVSRSLEIQQFQCHRADAVIEIDSQASGAALRAACGTSIQIDSSQVSCTWIAEITAIAGQRFDLEAQIARQWTIDSVETVPPDSIEDRQQSPRGGGQQSLQIRLRRAVQESRGVRLIIRAHRQRPAENVPFGESIFSPVTLSDTAQIRQLVSFRSTDPALEPRLSGDVDLKRLDPAQMTQSERNLFELPPGPLFFEFDRSAAGVSAALHRTEPSYVATINLAAQVDQNGLVQTARIRCVPDSSTVGMLVVRMSPAPPAGLVWQLEGEDPRGLVALPAMTSGDATPLADEAVWSLQLLRPRSSPFEIRAEFRSPLSAPRSLSLVSLPEASEQTGIVELGSADGTAVAIQIEGMKPLPIPYQGEDRFSALRGLFRYEPGRRSQIVVAPAAPSETLPTALIRNCNLESQFSRDGSGSHLATCRIENAGEKLLCFRMPLGATLQGVSVDEHAAVTTLRMDASDRVCVPLPEARRFPTVQISYTSRANQDFGIYRSQFVAPLPQFELPTLARHWTVQLAPGLRRLENAPQSIVPLLVTGAWQEQLEQRLKWNLNASPAFVALSTDGAESDVRGADVEGRVALSHWSRYELDLPDAKQAVIAVYRPRVLQAWGLALLLGVTGIVCWFNSERPSRLIAPLGVAAAALVLLPIEFSPLAAGSIAGLAAGAIWCFLKPRRRATIDDPFAPDNKSTIVLTGSAIWIGLLLGVAMQFTSPAHAAPVDALAPAQPVAGHRLVIPVGDGQQETGDYVYLSPGFYEELHRRTQTHGEPSAPWLIYSAAYDLTLGWQEIGKSLRVDELTAQVDVETFQPNARVRLPLRRDEATLLPGKSRLEGQPVVLTWEPDGNAIAFDVPRPGKYRLQLSLATAAKLSGDKTELDIAIPAVPQSRLRAKLPAESIHVESRTALGRRLPGENEAEVLQEIGPADRLVVQWPSDIEAVQAPAVTEVDSLVWWKLRATSAVVDAKFRFRPVSGKIQQVALRADPRLHLLSVGPAASVSRMWIEDGSLNTIHVALAEPAAGEVVLQATLLLPNSAALGQTALPTVEALADRALRQWTAISAGNGLQVRTAEAAPPAIATGVFLSAWGDQVPAPAAAAFDNGASSVPLKLQIEAVDAHPQATQSMEWSVSASEVLGVFRAALTQVPLNQFQYRLSIPNGLEVKQLTVYEKDRPVPARWTQNDAATISILLAQSAAASQTIELEGSLAIPKSGAFTMAAIGLPEADVLSDQVRIYRAADAQVRIVRTPGYAASDSAAIGEFVPQRGRLIAELRRQTSPRARSGAEIVLAIGPLESKTVGRFLTVVRRQMGGWWAEVECHLDCRSGALDAFRLEVPPEWVGPFEITPAVEHRVMSLPGQTRRHLLIRPPRAISGTFQLNIRGQLRGGESTTVRAPNVNLLDVQQVSRFLVVAGRADEQRIEWETNGLQAVQLNDSDWTLAASADDETFQVVAPRFEAAVKQIAGATGRPHILLADIYAEWQRNRRVVITAKFDVEPAGLSHCELEVPVGHQIAGVFIDGIPADVHALNDRAWRLRLALDQLAQRIEVVYSGRLPVGEASEESFQLSAPKIIGLPIDRTLWSIRGPVESGQRPSPPLEQASLLQQEFYRLESTFQAIQSSAATDVASLPAEVASNWYAPWSQRFDRLRASISRELPSGATSSNELQKRVRTILAEQKRLAVRMTDRAPPRPPAPVPSGTLLSEEQIWAADDRVLRMAASGALNSVMVEFPPPPLAATTFASLIVLSSIAAFCAALWLLARKAWLREWFVAQPHAWVAVLGIAWWTLAPLPWLGPVILLFALWTGLRTTWPRHPSQSTSSVGPPRRHSVL